MITRCAAYAAVDPLDVLEHRRLARSLDRRRFAEGLAKAKEALDAVSGLLHDEWLSQAVGCLGQAREELVAVAPWVRRRAVGSLARDLLRASRRRLWERRVETASALIRLAANTLRARLQRPPLLPPRERKRLLAQIVELEQSPSVRRELLRVAERWKVDPLVRSLVVEHLEKQLGRAAGESAREWTKRRARELRESAASSRREATSVGERIEREEVRVRLAGLGGSQLLADQLRGLRERKQHLEDMAKDTEFRAQDLEPEVPSDEGVKSEVPDPGGLATEPRVDDTMWPIQAAVARKLDVSPQRVRQMVKSGVLTTNGKTGRNCRIDPASVLAHMPNVNEDLEETDEEVERMFERAHIKGNIKGRDSSGPRSPGK